MSINPGRNVEVGAETKPTLFRRTRTAHRPSCYIGYPALASGAQALVVLDDSGQPSGVVDRDRLMTRLMKTLGTGAS